ncbi:MAG: 2-succinyl-5-enolpyruvyl-6-hydroxy-3-cyclohexene-1-carboxylic-acid synthase, partial [Prevotella sp.]|nr:2-succinyl-5-enolpyruvyl-6-hydroxy-3-cyclohexene-1-carboxylic-acid synthase [Prevotella sp.]
MYSNKESVNILTALMVAHGIHHVVVCPGSRNAPLVHNFTVCPDITCYPVTDERSAGFYALGLIQALDAPVAVCVTSGTALLNLFPAVAEACYQHLPLVIISADRPQAWIEQLDGQTLPQQHVFGKFVSRSVDLPEIPEDIPDGKDNGWLKTQRWYCNRLVNEAFSDVAAGRLSYRPVHVNIPISEPLADFSTESLPEERVIYYHETVTSVDESVLNELAAAIRHAHSPMIVIGQYLRLTEDDLPMFRTLEAHMPVLYGPLAGPMGGKQFDEVLYHFGDVESYHPDFVLYGGDTIVSKRLRQFLRQGEKEVWEISEDGEIHDTYQGLNRVVHGNLRMILWKLSTLLGDSPSENLSADYLNRWKQSLLRQQTLRDAFKPDYSQMAVVRYFEDLLKDMDDYHRGKVVVHYANSSSIRLANIHAHHRVYCNRGVNGIEGSVSTAAGFSLGTDRQVFLVTGDLSFFYDSNALWNESLGGNLKIILLNNGGGGIFHQLPVAKKSPEAIAAVAGHHHTTAKGLCESYNANYLSVHDNEELKQLLPQFLQFKSNRPVLLEVFTDREEDVRVVKEYYHRSAIDP